MSGESGLAPYVDTTISVITNDGRNIVGTLRGFDQATNLILDECFERVYSTKAGVETLVLGLYVIRGDNIPPSADRCSYEGVALHWRPRFHSLLIAALLGATPAPRLAAIQLIACCRDRPRLQESRGVRCVLLPAAAVLSLGRLMRTLMPVLTTTPCGQPPSNRLLTECASSQPVRNKLPCFCGRAPLSAAACAAVALLCWCGSLCWVARCTLAPTMSGEREVETLASLTFTTAARHLLFMLCAPLAA